MAGYKTAFLDRDGVLNEDPIGNYIMSPSDLKLLPGVMEGVKLLQKAGYRLIVISNQAGIGDGLFTEKDLKKVTDKLVSLFAEEGIRFGGIYYCLHGKEEGCECRKPEPGLFLRAAKDFSVDRDKSFFIGDKISDVEAGQKFGIKVIMLRTGHGAMEEKLITTVRPDAVVDGFLDAVRIVLSGDKAWQK